MINRFLVAVLACLVVGSRLYGKSLQKLDPIGLAAGSNQFGLKKFIRIVQAPSSSKQRP